MSTANETCSNKVARHTMLLVTICPIVICIVAFVFPESVWAVTEDSLREHTGAIENFLTGNVLRLSIIGGTVWGAIQSYMAGKFMILAGTLGIGIGVSGLLSWVKATWAYVI